MSERIIRLTGRQLLELHQHWAKGTELGPEVRSIVRDYGDRWLNKIVGVGDVKEAFQPSNKLG